MNRLTLPVSLAAAIILACGLSDHCGRPPAPATYTAKGTLEVRPIWTVPAQGGGTVEAPTPPEYYKMQVETAMAGVKSRPAAAPPWTSQERRQALLLRRPRLGRTTGQGPRGDAPARHVPHRGVAHRGRQGQGPGTGAERAHFGDHDRPRGISRRTGRPPEDSHGRARRSDQAGRQIGAGPGALSPGVRYPHGRRGLERKMARLQALSRTGREADGVAEAANAWNAFQEIRKRIESGQVTDEPRAATDTIEDVEHLMAGFPEVLERMNSDASIKALEQEISRMGRELQVAKATEKPEKKIKVAETILEAAQTDLESRRSMILGVSFQQEAATLKARFDRLRSAEADLLPRVKEAREAVIGAAKAADEYETRAAEFRRVLGLLQTVSNAIEQMRIAGALAEPIVRVVEYPMIPVNADAAKPAAKP